LLIDFLLRHCPTPRASLQAGPNLEMVSLAENACRIAVSEPQQVLLSKAGSFIDVA
jgi:hypothetical protein